MDREYQSGSLEMGEALEMGTVPISAISAIPASGRVPVTAI
jgi:hypothetical protein